MSYGFSIKNNGGREVVYGNEISYGYWGRFSLSKSANTDTTSTIVNIPSSYEALVFVHSSVDPSSTEYYVNVIQNSNNIQVRVNTTTNITLTMYVFVKANYLPIGEYGLLLFNSSGVVTFNSSRPLMKFKSITTVSSPSQSLSVDEPVAALCVDVERRLVYIAGINTTLIYYYSVVGTSNKVSSCGRVVGSVSNYPSGGAVTNLVRVPYISTSYYNQFSSLGNP